MAADGKPSHSQSLTNSGGETWTWEPYDEAQGAGLAIGPQNSMGFAMVPHLRADKCDFWDDHFLDD